MTSAYDVVVVGLGVMGAATLWSLASRGVRVLGIDARMLGHRAGSSHGASRIFRRAYWEGRDYVPMLNHADQRWRSLQSLSSRHLIHQTGGVFIGPAVTGMVAGCIHTAQSASVEHEVWSAQHVRQHLPVFNVEDGQHAVYEPGAYAIAAKEAMLAMLALAQVNGADLVHGDEVVRVERRVNGLRVHTRKQARIVAGAVVITAGPWIGDWAPELKRHLDPRQVPVYWFMPKRGLAECFESRNFPVFLYELEGGDLLYGVPSICMSERGVKIGFHNRQQTSCSPGKAAETVSHASIAEISEAVRRVLPGLEEVPAQVKTCIYTMSPDESFFIGPVSGHGDVFMASACSGHGFKFAPAIGDVLACLAVGEAPMLSVDAFAPGRASPD